jgi:hypothetical protein
VIGLAPLHSKDPKRSPPAQSRELLPRAPHLLPPSEGVTDDEVGETHWIVKNGIRFSGMPTFNTRLNETELWQVSLLLHNANKLPASVQEALRKPSGGEGSTSPASNTPAPSVTEPPSPGQSPPPPR